MIDITIRDHGTRAVQEALEDLQERPQRLVRVGYKVVRRAVESERRLFAAAPWPPKKASTLRRYRYPLTHFASDAPYRAGAGASKPLVLSGTLKHTLTTPQARGQRDQIRQVRGGLDVDFGLQAKGPVAYGNFQGSRHGARRVRDPLRFDGRGHGDATDDVMDFVLGNYGRGRR